MASPRFSVLTPIYETPPAVLAAMLKSVERQSFGDWELCLVDDASTAPHVRAMLAAGTIRRIRQTLMATNLAPGALIAPCWPDSFRVLFLWGYPSDS